LLSHPCPVRDTSHCPGCSSPNVQPGLGRLQGSRGSHSCSGHPVPHSHLSLSLPRLFPPLHPSGTSCLQWPGCAALQPVNLNWELGEKPTFSWGQQSCASRGDLCIAVPAKEWGGMDPRGGQAQQVLPQSCRERRKDQLQTSCLNSPNPPVPLSEFPTPPIPCLNAPNPPCSLPAFPNPSCLNSTPPVPAPAWNGTLAARPVPSAAAELRKGCRAQGGITSCTAGHRAGNQLHCRAQGQHRPVPQAAPGSPSGSTDLSLRQHRPVPQAAPGSPSGSTGLSLRQHRALPQATPGSPSGSTALSLRQPRALRSRRAGAVLEQEEHGFSWLLLLGLPLN
ncbi:unnamed protein product, partial [Coccothraustes coccothraustes]